MTGTWRLVRLALRRDRVVLPVWVVAISGLAWGMVRSYASLTQTEADRVATATLAAGNPLTRIFDGPASGPSIGALALTDGYKVVAILTALMAAQVVVRHSRREEELGRAELVGSAAVGVQAPLAAAVVVALVASSAVGAGMALAVGITGIGWVGAAAGGMAVAGAGWAFAGIAAVAAQVFSTARGANSATAAALGVAFVLRAAGDLAGHVAPSGLAVVSAWPSWLSPLGWGQQVRPYYFDRWWIAGLFAGFTALLVAVAAMLRARRDLGTGMVAAPRGPARAPDGLLSTLGMTWRLQRGVLGVWVAAMATMGGVFGSVGRTFADYIADNDAMRRMLETIAPGAAPLDLYQAFLMAFLGVACTGYTVQALLRMHAEESGGRLEPVLATAVGRLRWLGSHVLVVGLGSALVLLATGLVGGLVYGVLTGEWSRAFGGILAAAAVQVPAALALGGLVVAVFGALPRWTAPVAWFALAAALVMGQLGQMLRLPQWLLDVSPFTHVPAVPAEAFTATPLVWLGAAAVALGALGFAAFRRRDLAIGA
jgi:ABC-2 type transport system permease protein